jgi:Domain of unknown function (DUF4389)
VAALTYDVEYTEPRNRLTTAFRIILAIPHLIVSGVWQYLAEVLAVIQWFVILFTGKRNQGMWNLQWAWLGYASRVNGYVNLLYDPYPAFGTDPGPVPVRAEFPYGEPANRLTNGLRFIWAIPALVITLGLAIAGFFVLIVSWFAIVITGKHPRGMWDFLRQVVRYTLRTQSYVLLMTDTYPSWSDAGAPVGPPSELPTTTAAPPPPPPPQTSPPETSRPETSPPQASPPQTPPPHPPTTPPGSAPPPPPG